MKLNKGVIMKKNIETNWNELWSISNILNDVCHGINIDIEKEIKYKYDEIFLLLKKINSYEVKEGDLEVNFSIELKDAEINILKQCFRVILKEIEDWEFSTRIGVSINEANLIINKLTHSKVSY